MKRAEGVEVVLGLVALAVAVLDRGDLVVVLGDQDLAGRRPRGVEVADQGRVLVEPGRGLLGAHGADLGDQLLDAAAGVAADLLGVVLLEDPPSCAAA